MTTVPAEGPSAESFDRSLPRHPPAGGPGASSLRHPSQRPDRSVHHPFGWLPVRYGSPWWKNRQISCRTV